MKKLRSIISLLVIVFGWAHVLAQGSSSRIDVGDKVPEFKLDQIFNYSKDHGNLSEFNSELLLIEFWDVNCSSCIAGMPRLQKLQSEFSDRIKILLITKSTSEEVNKLLKNNSNLKDLTLPIVVGDTTVSKKFIYQTVPAYAWINKNGILTHFSSIHEFLNSKGIQKYLDGEKLYMSLKNEYGDFDRKLTLLTEGGGRNLKRIQSYSLLTDRVDLDQSYDYPRLKDEATNSDIGVRLINKSMIEMYRYVFIDSLYANGFAPLWNRVITERNPQSYFPSNIENYHDWKLSNQFCYEAVLPLGKFQLIKNVMYKDLNAFFGIKGRIEKRHVQCLVLKVFSKSLLKRMLTKEKGSNQFMLLPANGGDTLILKNEAFSSLLRGVELLYKGNELTSPPLINGTDIDLSTFIDITITGELSSLEYFRKQLRKYGLDLVPEVRVINMIVLLE